MPPDQPRQTSLRRRALDRAKTLLGLSRAADVATLVARTRSGEGRERLEVSAALTKVSLALDAGRHADARRLIDDLARAWPANNRVLDRRASILAAEGELLEPLRLLGRISRRPLEPGAAARERRLAGTLVETSTGWLPRIPGPPRPVRPRPGTILHLLKESAPELTNGFTMRSRYNLIAARDAGLSPVVVTSLGFPRTIGVEAFERLETVDGIPHHRLDAGPCYPLTAAPDRLLADQAWLTAGVARSVEPWIIHASSGFRGYETTLVGMALRAHIRRPLVYEVRSFFESSWSQDESLNSSGEMYDRRFATESRAMNAADFVLTIAETMREDIIGRGVPADRVAVIPNGVDAAAFAPRDPDPATRARHGLGDAFVFGYVSNLDHRRENQELLVEATRLLLGRGRTVACLIVGDGRRRAELEGIARVAGTGSAVVFTGGVPHDQVQAYYATLDAFVVPRRDERASNTVTPLKPYEALAMERPLVVASLPALLEIADPDGPAPRGLAFRAGDAAHLADQLERLMDDRELGRRLGATGRRWVTEERSWSANGRRLREVYAEVADRWAASHPEVAS
jgi:glycosyltransferase involved in cell wall biosynthesis